MGEPSLPLERLILIIVIEEDAAMRALILEWLKDDGYEARALDTASAGADAGIGGADVVVANIRNLRVDGAEEVRRLRAIFPRATVIGLSTQLRTSLPEDSELVRSLGISALLAKPFERGELLAVVARTRGALQ
jgi:DNA-binding response OmpR family regulator